VAEVKAYLSGGHVYCRVAREDRDLERCLGCDRFRQVADTSSPPYILCETPTVGDSAVGDPRFMEWRHEHHRLGRR
jgi:hypothetical protein